LLKDQISPQAQELHGTAEERNQQLVAQLDETKQELQRCVTMGKKLGLSKNQKASLFPQHTG
jgi:hypothetical protein